MTEVTAAGTSKRMVLSHMISHADGLLLHGISL